MTKQYTFKTTKTTEWMEPILDELSQNRDRSAVLREMVAYYLEHTGIREKYESMYGKVQEGSPIMSRVLTLYQGSSPNPARSDIVSQSLTKSHTLSDFDTQKDIQIDTSEEPSFGEGVEDVSEINLDKALDNLY